MNQLGDLKTFRVLGTPPVYPQPIYVYKWWDGSVIATGTASGSVVKRLNLGGNPAEGGGPPFVVPFRCDICDQLGNVVQVVPSTIEVNNPPTIVGAPTITPNNHAFPFETQVRVAAYDLENNSALQFLWYYGTNPIGGFDTTTGPTNVEGTYYGTLTGLTRDLYVNTLEVTVLGAGTVLTCKIVDGDSGTTRVNIPVQGYDPGAPQFSLAAQPSSLLADASTQSAARIAPGQTMLFSSYAQDASAGQLVFTWYLYGTNGWNAQDIPYVSHGTTTALPDKGWRGELLRPIDQETGSGPRTAILSVTNTSTGQSIYSAVPVFLEENQPPVMTSVGVYNAGGLSIAEVTKLSAPSRTVVRFSGTATDSGQDIVYFKWDFTAPADPASFTLYGRDAYVDVTDWPGSPTGIAYPALGVVTAVDRYGVSSSTFAIPQLSVKE